MNVSSSDCSKLGRCTGFYKSNRRPVPTWEFPSLKFHDLHLPLQLPPLFPSLQFHDLHLPLQLPPLQLTLLDIYTVAEIYFCVNVNPAYESRPMTSDIDDHSYLVA